VIWPNNLFLYCSRVFEPVFNIDVTWIFQSEKESAPLGVILFTLVCFTVSVMKEYQLLYFVAE